MKADTITKDDISDTTLFTYVFNYHIYDGEQLIRPELFAERDPTEIAIPYGVEGRHVDAEVSWRTESVYNNNAWNAEYVLYGIKTPDRNALCRCGKNNLYEAIEYTGQVEGFLQTGNIKNFIVCIMRLKPSPSK